MLTESRGAIKKSGQEKLFGEANLSEERIDRELSPGVLGCGQSEKGRQLLWNPEEGEGDPLSLICSSIAS